jgi:c-di-AMP phosphodiesterase-like protein
MNNIKNEFLLPTQIVSGELDNFELIQDKLIDWIYRYKNRNIQSDYKSNCGGWQNRDKNFYTAESFSKYYKIIQKSILDLISEYKFDLPLNINISSSIPMHIQIFLVFFG